MQLFDMSSCTKHMIKKIPYTPHTGMCYDFILMDDNSIFVFNTIYFPKENILYEHNTDNQILITWAHLLGIMWAHSLFMQNIECCNRYFLITAYVDIK